MAVYLGPIRPVQNSGLIAGLMVVYLVTSVILWFTLRSKPTADPTVCIGAHAADLFCTTALTVLSRGPGSPFFLFFVFVLLAAAYRWGFQGAMLTAGIGVALLAGEAYVLNPRSIPYRLMHEAGVPMAQQFRFSEVLLRCVYLLMVGLLLGYLAEGEKALQSEAATTAHIISKAQVGGGLRRTLENMFDAVLGVFGTARGMIVTEEIESGRMFAWNMFRPGHGGPLEMNVNSVERKQRNAYRPSGETGDWVAWKTRDGKYRISELTPWTPTLLRGEEALKEIPGALLGCESVLASPFALGKQWNGWIYLFDVKASLNWKKELRFLHRIVDATAPAAYNAYLLSRMRSQIGAQERGRLARELHDGPIQSLLAAELQMHVMRRKGANGPAGKPESLDQVEDLIHEQVLNLREMMEKIRPIDPDPRQLGEFLAERVEKFQRETGIEAAFTANNEPVRLTGRACREVIRIVQELLFNVRRHSGAGHVEVCLASQDGFCRIEVNDDGRGFDFSGRHDQDALEAMRKGPRVVQERLRALGGQLEIESYPGKGSRLKITLPQRSE